MKWVSRIIWLVVWIAWIFIAYWVLYPLQEVKTPEVNWDDVEYNWSEKQQRIFL
jgi:hypothetical protein